ncbi:MAG: protein kinase, partial [Anaerolineae bacterium]
MPAITSRTTSRLTDVRLVRVLRLVWLVVVPLALGMFLLSLPAEYLMFRDGEGWGLSFQAALSQLGLSREFFAAYITALDTFEVLFSLMLALIIFRQRADDWVAWLSSVLIAIYSTSLTLAFYLSSPALATLIRTFIPVLTIVAIVVYPDGRFIPAWTRWLVIGVLGISLLELLLVALNITGQYQFGYLGYPLAILALTRRYRESPLTAAERQQTKWVLWGVIISFFAVAVYWLVPMLFPQLASRDASVPVYTAASLISFLVTNTLRLSSSVIFVASLGLSIVHYRLWDIDLTINRSLVYGSLTLGLGAVFVLIFLAAQALLTAILGGEHAALSVAVSAAATAVLFHPVRTRIQHFVDRRIYGLNFDLHQLHQARQKPEIKNPGLLTGRRFGSYEVLGVLGRGGMGEVYQGFDGSQKVALKVLPADLAQQTEFLKRFEREAQAMKMLDHPYILKLIGSGVEDGIHYLALEYIDGLGLNEYLKQQGVLSLA